MKIMVTASNIANGKRCDAGGCPVYLACVDAGVSVLSVAREYASIRYEEYGYRQYQLPLVACDAIKRYDSMGLMEPFEFELDLSEANQLQY